jgi:hypothetical protein
MAFYRTPGRSVQSDRSSDRVTLILCVSVEQSNLSRLDR